MVLGLIGKRVGIVARRTNSNTFVELLMHRYNNSKVVGWLCGLVTLFFLGAFAVSTITGGGRIFQILTGADYRIGLAIFTVLVIIAAITGENQGCGIRYGNPGNRYDDLGGTAVCYGRVQYGAVLYRYH